MKKELIRTILDNGITVITEETEPWYKTTVVLNGEVVHEESRGDSFWIVATNHFNLARLACLGKFGSHDMRPVDNTFLGKIVRWLEVAY